MIGMEGGTFSGTTQDLIRHLIEFAETRHQPSCECGEYHAEVGDVEQEEAASLGLVQDPLQWYLAHLHEQQERLAPNGNTVILTPDAEVANRWRISAYAEGQRLYTVYVDDRFDSPTRIIDDMMAVSSLMPVGWKSMAGVYRQWDFTLLTEAHLKRVATDFAAVVRTMQG